VRRFAPLAAVLLLASMLVAGILGTEHTVKAAPAQVHMAFDIGWDLAGSATPYSDINQDDLFALQTENGTGLDTSFLTNVNVPQWVSDAHAHNVQALITIGGSNDQNWQNACNSTNRAGFVSNLVNYMQSNGFDGIDLDIEDDVWTATGPPDSDMTACIEAISTAAKAVKTQAGNTPIISADVITNWEGPWYAPSQSYVDQFNLMTYGDTCTPNCSSFQSDVDATYGQGIPLNKMVLGIDVIDSYPPSGDCGAISNYSAQNSLMGVMVWDINTDVTSHSSACLNQLAGASAPPPPSPSPTPVPPTPTPAPATPQVIDAVPCTVTINGTQSTGTCTGAFVP
jgi:chitinase